jgi:hypothetical protein
MSKISYGNPTSKAYKNLIELYKYDGEIDLPTFKNKLFDFIDEDLANDFVEFDEYTVKKIKEHFLLINII